MALFKKKEKKPKKKLLAFSATGGRISDSLNDRGKMILMYYNQEPGVVTIDKRNFYLLGLTDESIESMSGAKTLTGAAVGSLVAPLVGTLIGGAIGARKKKRTIATFALKEISTDEDFLLEGEFGKYEVLQLQNLSLHRQ